MKRKNTMMALACACCMALHAVPAAVMAEEASETEQITEEAAAETEQITEEAAAETEQITEEAAAAEDEVSAERPDYSALDYVTLGEYKGLTVQLEPNTVTDEDVRIQAEANLRASGADGLTEALDEGVVQFGDVATIAYVGTLDGVAFDGGTSDSYDLEIGSGQFIDGFEDGLIGVALGETVELNLTFPENYGAEELAGQEVVFTVTVNGINRLKELSDELVSLGTDGSYTDLNSYLSDVRATLEESAESDRDYEIRESLLAQIYNNSEINDYPQELVEYSINDAVAYYTSVAETWYAMTYEELVAAYGYTEEGFRAELELIIKESLQQELLLKAIAETEGIELSDEEYAAGVEKYMALYGYTDADAFVADVGGEQTMEISLLLDKVYDFLIENAVIEELEPETETETETETEDVTAADPEAAGEAGQTGESGGAAEAAEADTDKDSETEANASEAGSEAESSEE